MSASLEVIILQKIIIILTVKVMFVCDAKSRLCSVCSECLMIVVCVSVRDVHGNLIIMQIIFSRSPSVRHRSPSVGRSPSVISFGSPPISFGGVLISFGGVPISFGLFKISFGSPSSSFASIK